MINGEGKVSSIELNCEFPVKVEFNNGNCRSYKEDGVEYVGVNRCLFFAPPKFENWNEMISRNANAWKPKDGEEFY